VDKVEIIVFFIISGDRNVLWNPCDILAPGHSDSGLFYLKEIIRERK